MTDTEAPPALSLPAREIPIPTSVSPEAQAVLAMGRLGPPAPSEYPALDDVAGWKAFIAETDEFVLSMIGDPTAGFAGTLDERDLGPCPMYVVTPEGVAVRRPPRLLRHPRRRLHPRRGRHVQDDRHRLGQRHGGAGVGGRLPHAARPPLPGAARRLPHGLPPPAGGAGAARDHRRRHVGRREPGRRPDPAGPGRGPAPPGRRHLQHGRVRPHGRRRLQAHERRAGQRARRGRPRTASPSTTGATTPEIRTSRPCSATFPASRRRSS